MQHSQSKQQGFTIIEVMIVLVIAAVILLIVFLAVPALQRNSRNTVRKGEAARLVAAYQEFTINNGGVSPANTTDDQEALMALANTSTIDRVHIHLSNTAVSTTGLTNTLYFRVGAGYSGGKCDGNNAGGSNPAAKQIAAVYYIETASGRISQCIDS